MKIKKIIAWVLFLLAILTFFLMIVTEKGDSYTSVFSMLVSFIAMTLLIHYYSQNKKIGRFLSKSWYYFFILFIILIIMMFLLPNVGIILNGIISTLIGVLLIYLIFNLIFLIVAKKKVDLFILILICISLIGIIFKYLHFPGAGLIMVIGWSTPGLMFMFIIYNRIKEYDSRTNNFLNFFKNFICVSMTICFVGGTFRLMHWPGWNILIYVGLPLMILSIISLIFLLPGSNFIEWTREHKKSFYRSLLIPLIYLTILNSLSFVFSDTFEKILGKSDEQFMNRGFYFENYEIPNKDGL